MGNGIKLPYMDADADSVTVSGFGAGCTMSELMMIVHSESIRGAGLFQCIPYGIKYDETEIFSEDATPEALADLSIERIDDARIAGEIDDTVHLERNAVYIMSGGPEDINMPPIGQQAQKLVYEHYGTSKVTYFEDDVGHNLQQGYMLPGLK